MKRILKKSMSILLIATLLVSCWVFTAPKADAVSESAGTYTVQVTLDV